jgi:hypothetical protein
MATAAPTVTALYRSLLRLAKEIHIFNNRLDKPDLNKVIQIQFRGRAKDTDPKSIQEHKALAQYCLRHYGAIFEQQKQAGRDKVLHLRNRPSRHT